MHVALRVTLVQRLATVMVAMGSYIVVAALTRPGYRSNAANSAEIVRDGSLGIQVSSSLTWEAAIHSFSNLYHCGWNNGSARGNWCCGAQELTPEGIAGCCNTTLFDPLSTGGFQNFFAPATELNVSATNASASNATQSISNSGPSNLVSCSPDPRNASIVTPQQQSHERVAIGVGIGVPLGVVAFGSLLLLFREHKLRLRAEGTAGISNDKRFNEEERTGRARHEADGRNAPQELAYKRKHPDELNSQEVYEVAAHGQY